jgi:predicted amidohydrolase
MARDLTIAVVQMQSKLGQLEENLVKMAEWVTTVAARQRVDLIVFPELITSGAELGVRFTEMAQRVPGMVVNALSQRAMDFGTYIAFGMATKEKVESVLYNSAVLIGPSGELVEVYHKLHLRGEERMIFREGFKLTTADTELGTFGMMLGSDLAFPEIARCAALEGVEVLLALGNWEAGEMDSWKTYIRSRAMENAVFVVGANRVGTDVTQTFGGESMIVGPRGQIVATLADNTDAETGAPKEGVIVAKIDLEDVRRTREDSQVMQMRQPVVYRNIVRKY